MTVSEWIKLWDSINITTIPIYYYYKNNKLMKHKLYDINKELKSIRLSCSYENLTEYHISIYHETLDNCNFNYDQQEFYSKLHLEIPESTNINLLHMYIE